jgi:hypothetical protein
LPTAGCPTDLSEPVRIFHIIIGYPIDLTIDHFLWYVLYLFCRHTGINTSCLANRIFQNNRPCRDDGITVNYSLVHDDRPHTDQHIVMQRATMNNRMMPDRNIIPNCCAALLKRAMNTGAVLDVYFVPDPDEIDIASYNRVEPDTAIIAHDHISDDRRVWSYECVAPKLGLLVFYRKYDGHGLGIESGFAN